MLAVTLIENDTEILAIMQDGKMFWFRVWIDHGKPTLIEMTDAEVAEWHAEQKRVI